MYLNVAPVANFTGVPDWRLTLDVFKLNTFTTFFTGLNIED